MRCAITTVGTSLLTNAQRHNPRVDWDEGALLDFALKSEPRAASVEISTLSLLGLNRGERAVFLHTETEEGRACAHSLERYAAKTLGLETTSVEIGGLSYDEKRFKRALAHFVSVLIGQVEAERRRGCEVLLAAGGGFKAQFACSTLVGLLLDLPVYYIHETFSQLVEIPHLPIAWDSDTLEFAEDFFEWVSKDLRSFEEVRNRAEAYGPAMAEQIWSLIEEEEGMAFLSATGEALVAAYRRISEPDGTPVYLSNIAEKQWDQSRTSAKQKEAADRLLGRMRSASFRGKAETKNNSDCRFYPGGGRTNEHIAFFEDADGSIVIAEFFFNHADRDRKLDRREIMKANYERGRLA